MSWAGDETESLSFFRKVGEPEAPSSDDAANQGATNNKVNFDKK